MECWLKGESDEYPATWEGLYTLLEDMEFSQVSKELMEAVMASSTNDTNDEEDEPSTEEEAEQVYESTHDSSDEMDSIKHPEVNEASMDDSTAFSVHSTSMSASSNEESEAVVEIHIEDLQLDISKLSKVRHLSRKLILLSSSLYRSEQKTGNG